MRSRALDCEVCLGMELDPDRGVFLVNLGDGLELLMCEMHIDAAARIIAARECRPETHSVIYEDGSVHEEVTC